jgi:hypothetical protein
MISTIGERIEIVADTIEMIRNAIDTKGIEIEEITGGTTIGTDRGRIKIITSIHGQTNMSAMAEEEIKVIQDTPHRLQNIITAIILRLAITHHIRVRLVGFHRLFPIRIFEEV